MPGKIIIFAVGLLLAAAAGAENAGTINIGYRSAEIVEEQDLVFGDILLPFSGGGELKMTCDGRGAPTVTVPGDARNLSVDDDRCGKIRLIPHQDPVLSSASTIEFVLEGTTNLTHENGHELSTTFSLFSVHGPRVNVIADTDPATADADISALIFGARGSCCDIGASVMINSDIPAGLYTATFELVAR